jgi:hypothetical protein
MWTTVCGSCTIEQSRPGIEPAPGKNSIVELGFDCAFAKNGQQRKHSPAMKASIKSSLL